MHQIFFIFLIFLTIIPVAYAVQVELTLKIVKVGQTGFANDQVSLDENETLDLQNFVQPVILFNKNIGVINIPLTQQVQFVSITPDNPITLQNTDEPDILVHIPDQTTIFAPDTWNGEITPPTQITTSGTVPSGFQTPTTSISIGSPDVILVFDKVVTILLDNTTGQMAYKLTGTNNWNLISTCLGTFANPTSPTNPGECSISNGIDTKILTFHFTEFAELDEKSAPNTLSTSNKPSSSKGGSGRTGVGPANEIIILSPTAKIFPVWFQQSLVVWWVNDSITDQEFKNALGYLLDKRLIDIDIPERPSTQLMDLAPSTKHLFGLWSNEHLSDSFIAGTIHYYRNMGVW